MSRLSLINDMLSDLDGNNTRPDADPCLNRQQAIECISQRHPTVSYRSHAMRKGWLGISVALVALMPSSSVLLDTTRTLHQYPVEPLPTSSSIGLVKSNQFESLAKVNHETTERLNGADLSSLLESALFPSVAMLNASTVHRIPAFDSADRFSQSQTGVQPPLARNPHSDTDKQQDSNASETASDGSQGGDHAFIKIIERPLSREQMLQRDFHTAAKAYQRGDHPQAEALLKSLLARDDAQQDARLMLARLYVQQGKNKRAELILYEGLLDHPKQAATARLYAEMVAGQGRENSAIEALQNALSSASNNAEFHAVLAALYQRNGRPTASAERYRVALTLEPNRGDWWTGLGISNEQAGEKTRAIRAYKEALQLPLADALGTYARQRLDELSSRSVITTAKPRR